MDLQKFVESLDKNKPNIEKLSIANKLNFDSAKSIQNDWNFEKRDTIKKAPKFGLISEFIAHYNTMKISIGNIQFSDDLYARDWWVNFGRFLEFQLGINMSTSEIILVDSEIDKLVTVCAINESKFLEILVIYSDYIAREWEGYLHSSNEIKMVSDLMIGIAGGEKYSTFINQLLTD